jgi:hypothetical protein
VRLLTIHELPHILGEAINDPEGLSRGISNLVLRESVQPLQGGLDVVITEKFLSKFNCVALSNISRQRECAYSIVAL